MDSFDMEILDFEGIFHEGYRVFWVLERYVDWGRPGPFCRGGGVRLIFSVVAGGQALMRLAFQWGCRLWCCFLRRSGGGGACPGDIVFVRGYR